MCTISNNYKSYIRSINIFLGDITFVIISLVFQVMRMKNKFTDSVWK